MKPIFQILHPRLIDKKGEFEKWDDTNLLFLYQMQINLFYCYKVFNV